MNAICHPIKSLAALAGLFVCAAAIGQPQPAQPAQPAPAGPAPAAKPDAKASKPEAKQETPVLSGTVKSIDGKDIDLSSYAGQVVLVVNVASQLACNGLQRTVVKVFGQVGVEVVDGGLTRFDLDLHVTDLDAHLFGVNNLDLDGLDVCRQVLKTSGLLKH